MNSCFFLIRVDHGIFGMNDHVKNLFSQNHIAIIFYNFTLMGKCGLNVDLVPIFVWIMIDKYSSPILLWFWLTLQFLKNPLWALVHASFWLIFQDMIYEIRWFRQTWLDSSISYFIILLNLNLMRIFVGLWTFLLNFSWNTQTSESDTAYFLNLRSLKWIFKTFNGVLLVHWIRQLWLKP